MSYCKAIQLSLIRTELSLLRSTCKAIQLGKSTQRTIEI